MSTTQPAVEPHLAHRLRQLADTLTASSTRNTTQRRAETILAAGVALWTEGHAALTKAHGWSGPWPSGEQGPTGKGGHGDPTATAALSTDEPEVRYHQRLAHAIAFAVDNCAEVTNIIRAVQTTARRERPTEECAEHWCNDPAPQPRRGRCEPCAKWRQRWLNDHPDHTLVDCPPVPRETIDDRRIRRRRTRIGAGST